MEECWSELISIYQQIIAMLRWMIELGRIDILTEVSMLSQYQVAPRRGCLEGLYLIVHSLSSNSLKKVVFDPNIPDIHEFRLNLDTDWTEFYGNVEGGSKAYARTTWYACYDISFCLCKSCWKCGQQETAYWDIDFCQ